MKSAIKRIITIENQENQTFLNYQKSRTSVTIIGKQAFSDCGLKDIIIPDSVTNIENYAFAGCENLTHITLPDDLMIIDEEAFALCENLNNIILPNSLITIEDKAFLFCTSLTNITLPDNLLTIKQEAFADCKNLTNIALPSSITTIEYLVFDRCNPNLNLHLPKGSYGERYAKQNNFKYDYIQEHFPLPEDKPEPKSGFSLKSLKFC